MVRKFYSEHSICTALEQEFSTGHVLRGCFFPCSFLFSAAAYILTPEVDSLSLRVSWHCNFLLVPVCSSVSGKHGLGELLYWTGEGKKE